MLSNFTPGNNGFIVATGRPFSSGILADPGFDLVHAVFSRPLPLGQGLDLARRRVEAVGGPATALAAFELRIPEPLSPDSFEAFNAPYVERMSVLGLKSGAECVTARTNVAPTIAGITEPSDRDQHVRRCRLADGRCCRRVRHGSARRAHLVPVAAATRSLREGSAA